MQKNDCVAGFFVFFMMQKAYRICLLVYTCRILIACGLDHADC